MRRMLLQETVQICPGNSSQSEVPQDQENCQEQFASSNSESKLEWWWTLMSFSDETLATLT
jgi:hypothetical protein